MSEEIKALADVLGKHLGKGKQEKLVIPIFTGNSARKQTLYLSGNTW